MGDGVFLLFYGCLYAYLTVSSSSRYFIGDCLAFELLVRTPTAFLSSDGFLVFLVGVIDPFNLFSFDLFLGGEELD